MKVILEEGQRVKEVLILRHTESPNLGDRIEDEDFRAQFRGRAINDKLVLGEDLDMLTGATKSAEAVADGVRKSLQWAENLFTELEL